MWTHQQETRKNKLLSLSTSALADAMDSLKITKALAGILPRVPGAKIAGPVFTVSYQPLQNKENKFYNAGTYIDEVPSHHIIVIDNQGDTNCTNWGGILTQKAIQQSIAGTIINGSARDIQEIQKANYPLFTKGIFMVSGKNRVAISHLGKPVNIAGVIISLGDWVVGDDNGVIVIQESSLDLIIQKAEQVEVTEAKIKNAILKGDSLKDAREKYGYSTPWENKA